MTIQCPAAILTRQALREPAVGWNEERREVGHPLMGYGVFAGPAAQNGQLAPSPAGRYDLTGLVGEARFVCQYRGTDVTLTRLLPAGAQHCTSATARVAHAPDMVTLACN